MNNENNSTNYSIASGKAEYECRLGNRQYKYVVETVFKESGESMSDILLRLMKQTNIEKKSG